MNSLCAKQTAAASLLQGCGAIGGPCCPPPSDLGGDFTCVGDVVCEGAQLSKTYEAFLTLQGGNGTAPRSSYGMCVAEAAASDGAAPAAEGRP